MKRMMSWTPTPSHLMKQMPRKRGPRHKGLESTKWNDEISYLGSEKLMSFCAIFLVLHFASLICGNPLFGCYKGGNIRIYTYMYMYTIGIQPAILWSSEIFHGIYHPTKRLLSKGDLCWIE